MKQLIDKIPIEEFRQDINDGLWTLGSMKLTSPEYGFAEKINQIIEEIRNISERVTKLELK